MTNNLLWFMLPFGDLGLALHAFGICTVILLLILLEVYAPEGPKTYIPKRQRPTDSRWLKAFYQALKRFAKGLDKMIMNIKVRRQYRPQKPRTYSRRTRQKKQRQGSRTQVTNMTSTWSNPGSAPRAPARQFDLDSNDLMLDDGASAWITICKDDFVEPPKRVDRKVKGIKGHADATHRGTLKWYLEDDAGLVHVLVIQELTLFPMRRLADCLHNTSPNKPTITTPRKKVLDH